MISPLTLLGTRAFIVFIKASVSLGKARNLVNNSLRSSQRFPCKEETKDLLAWTNCDSCNLEHDANASLLGGLIKFLAYHLETYESLLKITILHENSLLYHRVAPSTGFLNISHIYFNETMFKLNQFNKFTKNHK